MRTSSQTTLQSFIKTPDLLSFDVLKSSEGKYPKAYSLLVAVQSNLVHCSGLGEMVNKGQQQEKRGEK